MLGIHREVAKHDLKIRAGSKPVKKRLRRFERSARSSVRRSISFWRPNSTRRFIIPNG
jgi:hypothetical protein